MTARSSNGRPWTFYALAAFFTLFVLFLYGPMSAIFILSFQGPTGGLTFPMNGVSLHWFKALVVQQRSGDFVGSFSRSIARDRKSTRLNSSHSQISYAVFCLKKKKKKYTIVELLYSEHD